MEENIYKQARKRAAAQNEELSTAEKACNLLHITREKLLMIEQSQKGKRSADPSPEDVLNMVKLYSAPELADYYCTHQCPLRKNEKPLQYENLGEISTGLMAALHFLDRAGDDIHSILRDSEVSEGEKEEFKNVIKALQDIEYSARSLTLWAKKNGYIE